MIPAFSLLGKTLAIYPILGPGRYFLQPGFMPAGRPSGPGKAKTT